MVMESGSEIVVLTDAPSHNASLKMNVTDKAQGKTRVYKLFPKYMS